MNIETMREFLDTDVNLNGGRAADAEFVRDPAPGPMYADVYAVRVPSCIDLLVYVDHDGRLDFEEVEFHTWPPRSNYP